MTEEVLIPLPQEKTNDRKLRQFVFSLLAKREYSRSSLKRKLVAKGVSPRHIVMLTQEVEARGFLDEKRFCEVFINKRKRQGVGPLKIKAELKEEGISAENVEFFLMSQSSYWPELLQRVKEKKFGIEIPNCRQIIAKQMRYLQARGFDLTHIYNLYKESNF